tara:strand:+ start:862 stop:1182 length:321 start_codon:yes stop_codon:yes gene_type:complete
MTRAKGKYAFGICDRTGFRYPIDELVFEFNNGKRTGSRVGRDVADRDHPQNFVGRVKTDDSQSIRNARPDRIEPLELHVGVPQSEDFNKKIETLFASVGSVTITVS